MVGFSWVRCGLAVYGLAGFGCARQGNVERRTARQGKDILISFWHGVEAPGMAQFGLARWGIAKSGSVGQRVILQ